MNPNYPDAGLQLQELQEAARVIKRQLNIARASTDAEIDAAFMSLAQQGAAALLVTEDPFLGSRNQQIVALAARYKLPVIYYNRTFAKVGGLVSYGADFADGFRQAGIYAGGGQAKHQAQDVVPAAQKCAPTRSPGIVRASAQSQTAIARASGSSIADLSPCPLMMMWTAPTLRHQECYSVVALKRERVKEVRPGNDNGV